MAAAALNNLFADEALRMQGDVKSLGLYQSRFSAVIEKGVTPAGAGFNWQSLVYDNSLPTDTVSWTAVQANDGSTNTCVPTANQINSAYNIFNYSASQTAFRSEDICITDAVHSYEGAQQTDAKKKNFEKNIVAAWEQQDRVSYISACRWKYVANPSLNYTDSSASFPLNLPQCPISQELMSVFYRKLVRDGADVYGGAYSMLDGKPIFLAMCSSEAQEQLIKTDANVRQDYRYAEMGEGKNATLLKPFNIDRPYGGFFYMVDDRMPRYDFVAGAWLERAFLANSTGATSGTRADVNALYENAEYEDVILFHPKVVQRQMPAPVSTAGAGTTFKPVDYSGQIVWLNIPNATENPFETVGHWRAELRAAYRPELIQYGYVVRISRCTGTITLPACY